MYCTYFFFIMLLLRHLKSTAVYRRRSVYFITVTQWQENVRGYCSLVRQINVVDLPCAHAHTDTDTQTHTLLVWRYEDGWHFWCHVWGHGLFSPFLQSQSPRLKGEGKIRPFVWLDNVLLTLPWEITASVCVGAHVRVWGESTNSRQENPHRSHYSGGIFNIWAALLGNLTPGADSDTLTRAQTRRRHVRKCSGGICESEHHALCE